MMELWTMPSCYVGAVWPATYVFLGQNRDSDAITRSNFRVALKRLGGESETVQVVRESHWACGWVEWIAIHQDDEKAVTLANEMLKSIEDYPVLDESDWSDLEYTEAMEFWDSMSLSMKVDYCRDAKVSVFAARRNSDLPEALYESLTNA